MDDHRAYPDFVSVREYLLRHGEPVPREYRANGLRDALERRVSLVEMGVGAVAGRISEFRACGYERLRKPFLV